MAKVYSHIEGFREVPVYEKYESFDEYLQECTIWEKELISILKNNSQCPEAGEIIQFPVADGYARYAVYTLKPVQIVHIPIGDAWHFEYANKLTATDIRKKIRQTHAMKKLFSKKI